MPKPTSSNCSEVIYFLKYCPIFVTSAFNLCENYGKYLTWIYQGSNLHVKIWPRACVLRTLKSDTPYGKFSQRREKNLMNSCFTKCKLNILSIFVYLALTEFLFGQIHCLSSSPEIRLSRKLLVQSPGPAVPF